LLAAVPVLGLATLSADLATPVRANESAAVSPFTFDAPAATLAQYRFAEAEEASPNGGSKVTGKQDLLVLDDWEFTATYNHRHTPPKPKPKPKPKSPHH